MFVDQLRKIIPGSVKRAATDHEFWLRSRLNLLARPMYSGIGSILAFHRVCEQPATPRLGLNADLEITPMLLEQTIQFCKRKGFTFVSLDELAETLRSSRRTSRFVAFTIDDGYADTLENAYPIFKKHRVPFAVYVTTCFPNRTAILWWYVLEDLILRREQLEVEIDGQRKTLDCSTLAAKNKAFDTLAGYLTLASNTAELKSILSNYDGDFYSYVNRLAMTWDQVRELSYDPLVTIGAHSKNHLALASLSDAEARNEVVGSKDQIEQEIQKPVQHFAYPYGGREAAGVRDFAVVQDAGFKTATTTRNGNVFASHSRSQHCLPRIPVHARALENGIDYLTLWTDGLVSCHENSFQRVVTV